jgi:hypothetical protein
MISMIYFSYCQTAAAIVSIAVIVLWISFIAVICGTVIVVIIGCLGIFGIRIFGIVFITIFRLVFGRGVRAIFLRRSVSIICVILCVADC